jgi:hypothetical protein
LQHSGLSWHDWDPKDLWQMENLNEEQLFPLQVSMFFFVPVCRFPSFCAFFLFLIASTHSVSVSS